MRSAVSIVNRPAAKAKRYVGNGSVGANRRRVRWLAVSRAISAPLASASHDAGISSASVKRAFRSGWSKQGNARRARAGTNRVYMNSAVRFNEASPASKSNATSLTPAWSADAGMTRCSFTDLSVTGFPPAAAFVTRSPPGAKSSASGAAASFSVKRTTACPLMGSAALSGIAKRRS